VGVHLSASIHDGARARRSGDLRESLNKVVRAWRSIADSSRTPTYLGLSTDGIAHFFVEQES
jgi:hypothetical protein